MSRRTTIPEVLLRRPGIKVQGGLSSCSPLGRRFMDHWQVLVRQGAPQLIAEHPFALPRKFRFDFAHPGTRVAVELHGGVDRWKAMAQQGRHVRPKGFESDCEKWRLAAELDWVVFPFTSAAITAREVQKVAETIERRRMVRVTKEV